MKHALLLLTAFLITQHLISQNQNDEQLVKQTANSWFNSFNRHDYNNLPDYTTEDCFMINPLGLYTRRSNETPALFNKAHETFLKNLSLRVDSMGIRFVSPEVAIATVISQQIVAPSPADGTGRRNDTHENDKLISTMVIVKQNNKWLITQYQNTFIASVNTVPN